MLRPSEFVEGGGPPVDMNLLWKECRFDILEYTKRDGSKTTRPDGSPVQTPAARITYQDDNGKEHVQHYSAGDIEKFVPSKDGKQLVAVGSATSLVKGSNLFILMTALESAGFPMNRVSGDITVLDGLYTHNIGQEEPKRQGLVRPQGEDARPRSISVPDHILRLPWEGKSKPGARPVARPAARAAAAPEVEEAGDNDDVTPVQKVIELVVKMLESADSVTRQQVATRVFRDFAKDPDRDDIVAAVFQAPFKDALPDAGLALEGENISKS